MTPRACAFVQGFLDEMRYEDKVIGLQRVKDSFGKASKSLYVLVDLYAWPGTSGAYNQRITRAARPEDVQDIEFALVVDERKTIKPIFKDESMAPVVLERSRITSETTQGSVYNWKSSSYTTVQFETLVREEYTACYAQYIVVFPLEDDRGRALITDYDRVVSFRAFRITHEHKADFKLSEI